MKFKLDENFDARLAPLFAVGGHDVETVRDQGMSGEPDDTVYEVCGAEGRILVTLDLDFSNPLRFPPGPTEGVVVVRPARPVLPLIAELLRTMLPALTSRPLRGKLWIVEWGGFGYTTRVKRLTKDQTDRRRNSRGSSRPTQRRYATTSRRTCSDRSKRRSKMRKGERKLTKGSVLTLLFMGVKRSCQIHNDLQIIR